MHAIDLTTIPVGPTEFGHWAALNAPLGLEAFGVNVAEAGPDDQLEIAHDETESGQQELFVVISGRARFTVGDESIEAGPGTAVGVADPALQRGYEALEPGTRVLCIGAQAPGGATRWGYWIGGGEP
jgi:uncharacterized cupin superfamily protein